MTDFLEKKGITFQVATMAALLVFVIATTASITFWKSRVETEIALLRVEITDIERHLDRVDTLLEAQRVLGTSRDVQYAQIMVELQYIKRAIQEGRP